MGRRPRYTTQVFSLWLWPVLMATGRATTQAPNVLLSRNTHVSQNTSIDFLTGLYAEKEISWQLIFLPPLPLSPFLPSLFT